MSANGEIALTGKKMVRFSNNYLKLPEKWPNTEALLLAVVNVPEFETFKKENPAFIEYDTAYTYKGEKKNYPLEMKEAIVLVLIHKKSGVPFTTIRRYDKGKYEWYLRQVGKNIQIEPSTE